MQRKRKASETLFASATEDLHVKIKFGTAQERGASGDMVEGKDSSVAGGRGGASAAAAASASASAPASAPAPAPAPAPVPLAVPVPTSATSASVPASAKTKSSPSGSPMSNAGASLERPPDCPHLSALSAQILLRAPSLLGGANVIESLRCKHCLDQALAAARLRTEGVDASVQGSRS